MIRATCHSLLSVLLLAGAALLGGCAPDATSSPEEGSTIDALIDPGNAAEDASDIISNERAPGVPLLPANGARLAPTEDSRTWGAGEPHPIPWHETSASPGSTSDDPTSDSPEPGQEDSDSPLVSSPASPSSGR